LGTIVEPDPRPDATISRSLLWVGLSLAVIETAALGVVAVVDPGLFRRIVTVAGAAFVGGRMPGILTGLELGLGALLTSVVNICLNTCWLMLALPAFQRVTSHAGSSKLVRRFFRGAEASAQQQTERVSRLGLFGLVIFVWLPVPGTGAFVGALIGLIMGIRLSQLVPLLLASMWIGVVSWTYGIELVFLFTGRTGHIIAWVVTVALLLYAVASRLRLGRNQGSR
jgi:uncharacterized membrane protein